MFVPENLFMGAHARGTKKKFLLDQKNVITFKVRSFVVVIQR